MNRFQHQNIIRLCALLLAALVLFGCAGTSKVNESTPAPVSETQGSTPAVETEEVILVTTPDASGNTPVRSTAVPVVTAEPTATPEPEPDGLIGWSVGGFVNREDTVKTESEYVSDKLHFTVTRVYDTEHFTRKVVYFVTDLYIRDLNCLRTYAANEFTTKEHQFFKYVHTIAEKANALWAMTGDYCGHHMHSVIIRNGVVYDTKPYDDYDILFLYKDGTMETVTVKEYNADALRDDIWQAWQFGPSLLDSEGHAITDFGNSKIKNFNPRSIIGYYEPGHYVFLTVDGRQRYSGGLSLAECAVLMESLGCKIAFNLDGGESAELYWNGGVYNTPCDGGRVLSDIIYLIDEDTDPQS